MNESSIRKYAKLMEELNLSAIEIDEKGNKVRLERFPKPPMGPPPAGLPVMPPMAAGGAEMPTMVPSTRENAPAAVPASGETVTSPMVGVFYAAPAENADPYVKIGDLVKKGDTLCIVEAMKLMNEITAEFDGKVVDVLAANGQVVEYGTPLFIIER